MQHPEPFDMEKVADLRKSERAVIDYLVAYRELHSLEFCALALGNVYGPRQDPHGEAGVVNVTP